MTDKLAELRELTRAATPGPWVAWDDPGEWMDPPVVAVDDGHPRGAGHIEIAEMGQSEAQGSHNARFIAVVRNALPALLDVVEAARHYVTWFPELDVDASRTVEHHLAVNYDRLAVSVTWPALLAAGKRAGKLTSHIDWVTTKTVPLFPQMNEERKVENWRLTDPEAAS